MSLTFKDAPDETINFNDIKIDVSYVGCTIKLSDIMDEEDYNNLTEDSIITMIKNHVNGLKKSERINVYVKD